MSQNYTLGRGRVLLGLSSSLSTPLFRYFGHTTEFNINFEENTLDHWNMDQKIKEKDEQVTLEVTRAGSLITDHISPENVAAFILGTASTIASSAGAATPEAFTAVLPDQFIQLGASATNPGGVKGVASVVITETSSDPLVTFTAGTDYELIAPFGMFRVIPTGSMVGKNVSVAYSTTAHTRDRIISGRTSWEGPIKFISDNTTGANRQWFIPRGKLRANGDFALKGDEWQTLSFAIEVLKPAQSEFEAIYIDGVPVITP